MATLQDYLTICTFIVEPIIATPQNHLTFAPYNVSWKRFILVQELTICYKRLAFSKVLSLCLKAWTCSCGYDLLACFRYLAIVFPLHYHTLVTPGRSVLAIVCTWLFAGMLWLLPLVGLGSYTYNDEEASCYFDLVSFPTQWVSYSLLVFLPSSAVIIFCYAAILRVSLQQRASLQASLQTQHLSTSRSNKPVKTLILIIGAFYLAWLPFFIEHLIKARRGSLEEIPEWLESTIFILAVNNSFWNPIIYMRTNSRFRHAGLLLLKKMFPCCIRLPVGPDPAEALSTVT